MFSSPIVLNAQNPHAKFGYFHGPVPNQNVTGWIPEEQKKRVNDGRQPQSITVAQNSCSPNPRLLISKCNGGICMTETMPGSNIMCGITFENGASFWRHQRDFHVGATDSPKATSISSAEATAADLAFRKFVLMKTWRNAVFLHEPGYGPRNPCIAKIGPIADQLEAFARKDKLFAAKWGKSFHRQIDAATTTQAKLYTGISIVKNPIVTHGNDDYEAEEEEEEEEEEREREQEGGNTVENEPTQQVLHNVPTKDSRTKSGNVDQLGSILDNSYMDSSQLSDSPLSSLPPSDNEEETLFVTQNAGQDERPDTTPTEKTVVTLESGNRREKTQGPSRKIGLNSRSYNLRSRSKSQSLGQ